MASALNVSLTHGLKMMVKAVVMTIAMIINPFKKMEHVKVVSPIPR